MGDIEPPPADRADADITEGDSCKSEAMSLNPPVNIDFLKVTNRIMALRPLRVCVLSIGLTRSLLAMGSNASSTLSPTASPTSDDDDDASQDSVFGPGVSPTAEIAYVLLIIAAVLCMMAAVAFATVRRCRSQPYAHVEHRRGASSSAVVNYVDEQPGDHDIDVDGLMRTPFKHTHTHTAAATAVAQETPKGDAGAGLLTVPQGGSGRQTDREDSLSAMSI